MAVRVLAIDKTGGLPTSDERFRALAAAAGTDFELHVLCPERWFEHGMWFRAEPGDKEGYTLHTAPVLFPGYYARHFYASGMGKLFRRLRPETIQLFEEPYALSALQAMHFRKRFAPDSMLLFYTWENVFRGNRYPARVQFLYRNIDRRAFREAGGAVCATPPAEEVLKRKGYSGPIRTITYGIENRFLEPDEVEKEPDPVDSPPYEGGAGGGFHSGKGPFAIGYVGRLLPMKGVDLAIRTLKEFPDAGLEIVGEGPERESLETLCGRIKVRERVIFHGALPSEEVVRIMKRMDALVLPSRITPIWEEQLGRVLIEAMALGVPVAASRTGSIPFVVGEAGLLFGEDDLTGLVACLKRIREDPSLRNSLIEKGRERVRNEFTWSVFAERLSRFWRELLEKGHDRRRD